jgi:glycosyltransferase involved in cell wall biosynthesis
MKLSLCMIVRDEEEYLDQCLKSVADYVDEIVVVDTGSKDKTKKIAAKYGAHIYDFEWVEDFSAARNFAASKVTGDWYVWLDADDTVEHPEKLRQICEQAPEHIGVVFLNYDYQVDDQGIVRVKQWRDRLIRNNGCVTWKGRLHETPVDVRRIAKAQNTEVNIVHHAKPDRWTLSSERNMRILLKQMEDEKDNPDPRTFFYLASCYREVGRDIEARQLYEMYLKLSGWDEERCMARCQLAEIAFDNNDDPGAIAEYMQAIIERPDFPTPYIGLGKVYMNAEKYNRAIQYLEMALVKPEPKTSMVMNPLDYTYRPWLLLAECKFREGSVDDAIAACKKALTYRDDDLTRGFLDTYNKLKGHKLAAEAFTGLAQFLELMGEPEKVRTLLGATPSELQDNPMILRILKKYTEPKTWPKKSVVIFTGASAIGEWGPWSLEEGIGGSEEAIIRLSRRLVQQGYAVTVYANPGNRAGCYQDSRPFVFDASYDVENSYVDWRNYWELDLRDTFDIFVAWRSPWFFDADVNARKKYLWLHDVMEPGEFTPERLAKLDKVIVLSKYHRSLFPNIPDSKIMLSANGIDVDEFEAIENSVCPPGHCDDGRDPHTVVYQSSHVRGLSHLYDIWPEVKKAVPDAKLRIMYGWDSYIAINKDNPERMDWMEKMKRRCEELEDVVDLGKVSQEQIAGELLYAGVWAYPCTFPEISCITAMKAQAGGAIPVSSNFAALDETVQWGTKLDLGDEWNDGKAKEAFTGALIETLLHQEDSPRAIMMAKARKKLSWTNVAKQWISEFDK